MITVVIKEKKMTNKNDYISERINIYPELPKGMWKDVKNKVANEVNFRPTNTQTFIYVFLNFLQKSINDYDIEKNGEKK